MSAADNLNPQLFHGTAAWLKPGEIIKPGTRDIPYQVAAGMAELEGKDPGPIQVGAYATTRVEKAKEYATEKLLNNERDELAKTGYAQRALFAPVYEVSHLSEHTDPLNRLPKGGTFRRDPHGFEVKRVAAYGHYDGERPD